MEALKRVTGKEEILQNYIDNIKELKPKMIISFNTDKYGIVSISIKKEEFVFFDYHSAKSFLQGIYYGIQL